VKIFNREIYEKGMRHGWEKAGTFNIQHRMPDIQHWTGMSGEAAGGKQRPATGTAQCAAPIVIGGNG
jgi:hypothetical protein